MPPPPHTGNLHKRQLRLAVVLIGDVNTAEDIVHDVFVRFARSADRIKLTGSLKNYLVTSVIHRVRNHLRDSNRHRETNLDGAEHRSIKQVQRSSR